MVSLKSCQRVMEVIFVVVVVELLSKYLKIKVMQANCIKSGKYNIVRKRKK